MKNRTLHDIREEIAQTYKEYKGLQKGSVAFRNVSKKLLGLQREEMEARQ
jgi:hypothetical protein